MVITNDSKQLSLKSTRKKPSTLWFIVWPSPWEGRLGQKHWPALGSTSNHSKSLASARESSRVLASVCESLRVLLTLPLRGAAGAAGHLESWVTCWNMRSNLCFIAAILISSRLPVMVFFGGLVTCVPTPYHHHQRFFENLKWQKMAKLTTLNRWGFFRISMGKWTPDRVLPKFAMNTTTLEVECSIWMDIHLCVFSFVSFKDKYLGQIWWTTEQENLLGVKLSSLSSRCNVQRCKGGDCNVQCAFGEVLVNTNLSQTPWNKIWLL